MVRKHNKQELEIETLRTHIFSLGKCFSYQEKIVTCFAGLVTTMFFPLSLVRNFFMVFSM